jgi:hypothetical protein
MLNIWTVKDAEQVYRRYFAGSHGPNLYLFRDDWLVVAPASTRREAIRTIRTSFGAHG